MISKEHNKHSDLAKPSYGKFNRNEWAIVGTQCNNIKLLADTIITALSSQYKCTYVDAKHSGENGDSFLPPHLASGAIASYVDHINYQQFNFKKEYNDFQLRQLLNDADIAFVNGNHFQARSQIVVIDETKKESLKKRTDQLTNIELVLLADSATDVFDFMRDLPSFSNTPVLKLEDISGIIDFFKTRMLETRPVLNGLVLAGGRSKRMGFDKGTIQWHAKEQQYYVADLLKKLCETVFISCRADQQKEIDINYNTLADTFIDLGPYGAILSAFRAQPDKAWLVVACDLPLLDLATLQYLKENRNSSCMATAFESPYNHFPEPLITIWEPKSYPVLLSFLSQGLNCPGKALRSMDTTVLNIQNPETLMNVNTPEDFEKVQHIIQTMHPHHVK